LSAAAELSPDLLEDTIALCHPDRHPIERAERAGRVTAQLLALRPHVATNASRDAFTQDAECKFALEPSKVALWVTVVNLTASGVVTREPAHLLSIRINSRDEGASLTLYDALTATNPSTGTIKPNVETRYLHTTHRKAIYAEIRGVMDVTFFYLGA
jgi:hypothetical protein